MALVKTNALILKYVNLNDNDRLFTIFSPELGKITAMSKGIRSHKHKDFSALQLFCYSELVLDTSKGLAYINSALIKENFYDLRTSVEKTSLASYFMDLVSFVSDEIEFDGGFFSFVLNSLYLTANAEKRVGEDISYELKRLKCIFEIKTACVCGYAPSLIRCSVCKSDSALSYFDTLSGIAVCEKCFEGYASPELIKTSSNAIRILGFIASSDNKSVFSFKADDVYIEDASRLSERYLINKLEYASPMLDYLKNI